MSHSAKNFFFHSLHIYDVCLESYFFPSSYFFSFHGNNHSRVVPKSHKCDRCQCLTVVTSRDYTNHISR